MPAPTKCTIDEKYSLYSKDNLSTIEKDFSNLSEVQINGKQPFKECKKRIAREKENRINKDISDKYKEDANQYDEKSVNYRFSFFNRTLCKILKDPTIIKGDDSLEDDNFTPSEEKKEINNKSQWKKSKQAEEYFDSLLDKYENERKELKNNAIKQSEYKSNHHDNDDDKKDFKMSHEEQYKNFKKLMGYENDSDTDDLDGEISYIWNAFNMAINEKRSDSSNDIPNTPMLSSEGLKALQTFINNVNSAMYKNKSFESTNNFLKKFKDALCDFFDEKGKELKSLSDKVGGNDSQAGKDDDDDDGSKLSSNDEETPSEKYNKLQQGYVRVVDFALKNLTGSIMSDARSMKQVTEEAIKAMKTKKDDDNEDELGDEKNIGIFGYLKMGLTMPFQLLKAKFTDAKKDPERNGLLSCLVRMTDELNSERKNLLNFQKTHKQGEKGTSDDLDKQSTDKNADIDDTYTKDIYKFVSTLSYNNDLIGKKFISLRARLLFIKDCLDIRFNYADGEKKSDKQLEVEKELRKRVYDYLTDFDLSSNDLNITKTQDIIDYLSNKKKMNKLKEKINEIVSKDLKLEPQFTQNNAQYKKEKKLYETDLRRDKIPDDMSGASNDKVKLYISLDGGHQSVFDADIKKLKIPTDEDAFLRFVYRFSNGKDYLKHNSIASYLDQFIKCYDISEPEDKSKLKQNEIVKTEFEKFTDAISSILSSDYKNIPKKIYSKLSNPKEEEKFRNQIEDRVDKDQMKASSLFDLIQKSTTNSKIFTDEQQKKIKEQIDKLTEFIKSYKADTSEYKTVVPDDIKPYIIYDETLMKKETDAMSKDHKDQTTKARFKKDEKLYADLGNTGVAKKKKEFLLKRAKIGYLYVFLQTQLFDDQFYETTLQKQKETDSNLSKINDLRAKMINYDVDKLSKTIDNDFDKNVNPLLEQFNKDKIEDIVKNTYENLNKMEEVDKDDEKYTSLYEEYNKIKNIESINDVNNDELKKIIFYNSKDWEEKLEDQKGKLEKYKKTKKFEGQKKTFDDEISKKKKIGIYNELINVINNANKVKGDRNDNEKAADPNLDQKLTSDEAEIVKTYLFNRIKLNLIRIYAETSLFGLQIGDSEDEKKKYSSINTQLLNNIKELKFWENNIRDVVDILQNKNKKNKVKEKDKDGKEVEKDVLDKDCRAKFDNLINKYKNINESAGKIMGAVLTKTNWTKKGKEGGAKGGVGQLFAKNEDFESLTGQDNSVLPKTYPLCEQLSDLFKNNKFLGIDIKIEDIIKQFDLKYNCMSFDEKDFNKELEEAKKIQNKNTL